MREKLKEYYGQILSSSKDLQTNACTCDSDSMSSEVKQIISEIAPEIIEKFYGCGSPIPPVLKGRNILVWDVSREGTLLSSLNLLGKVVTLLV